jgi:hypothetical protein
MQVPRPRFSLACGLALLATVVVGCGSTGANSGASPTASPTAALPGLLGLGGETSSPLQIGVPYAVVGNLGLGPRTVESESVPDTATAAVTALAQDLGVPGPPISTASGLGYNLGSTSGYQLTTDPTLTTFNFHPNTPTDEVGTTPTVARADAFAENFLSAAHVPAGGGVVPITQLSTTNGSDRSVYFQWTLNGFPVVNILGQPEEIWVSVATDQHQVTQLVGISGAIPYGATGRPVVYPAMAPSEVVQYLNAGTINPNLYLLSLRGKPFPSPSPAPTGPVTLGAESLALVDSYGTAVPVYVFQVLENANVSQFVTCAVPPAGCLPLRFRSASPSPKSSPSD